MTNAVILYTDGSCLENPGPGGWAAILQWRDEERELSGGEADSTNNRMELQAAIEGLRALKRPMQVDLYTDSTYVMKGVTEWMPRWKVNGWRTAAKKPVQNQDLWQALDAALGDHDVRWHWVKGHAGNEMNERCDELARAAAARSSSRRSASAVCCASRRSATDSGFLSRVMHLERRSWPEPPIQTYSAWILPPLSSSMSLLSSARSSS